MIDSFIISRQPCWRAGRGRASLALTVGGVLLVCLYVTFALPTAISLPPRRPFLDPEKVPIVQWSFNGLVGQLLSISAQTPTAAFETFPQWRDAVAPGMSSLKAVVVCAAFTEDERWYCTEELTKQVNHPVFAYTPRIFDVDHNTGREASRFFHFACHAYDDLPEHVFFVHGHEYAWHHAGSLGRNLINRTQLSEGTPFQWISNAYKETGAWCLDRRPGPWPLWAQTFFATKLSPYIKSPNGKHGMPLESYGNNWLQGQACGAEFVVSRSLLQAVPKQFYCGGLDMVGAKDAMNTHLYMEGMWRLVFDQQFRDQNARWTEEYGPDHNKNVGIVQDAYCCPWMLGHQRKREGTCHVTTTDLEASTCVNFCTAPGMQAVGCCCITNFEEQCPDGDLAEVHYQKPSSFVFNGKMKDLPIPNIQSFDNGQCTNLYGCQSPSAVTTPPRVIWDCGDQSTGAIRLRDWNEYVGRRRLQGSPANQHSDLESATARLLTWTPQLELVPKACLAQQQCTTQSTTNDTEYHGALAP